MAAGSLATLSFTLNWVQRRNIADLPLDRIVLPSFALLTAFFALAVASSIWVGAAGGHGQPPAP